MPGSTPLILKVGIIDPQQQAEQGMDLAPSI